MRLTLGVLLSIVLFASCRTPSPEVPVLKRVDVPVEDRVEVTVTINEGDQALIEEVRTARLEPGNQELRFMNVSDKIVSESVEISATCDSGEVDFSEQNYNTDLINPDRIKKSAVDSEVRIYSKNSATGDEVVQEGILRNSKQGLILETDRGLVLLDEKARIEVDDISQALVEKPVLSWLTYSEKACLTKVEAAYLTKGLSWSANYIIDLAPGGGTADVRAFATLKNKTTLSLDSAVVKLFGGVDSYVYESERSLDLRPNQDKQIGLLKAADVAVSLTQVVHVDMGKTGTDNVTTLLRLELEHSFESPLNMPLPKGTASIWTEDSDTATRLDVGHADVVDTAVGEPLRIEIGGSLSVDGKWVLMRVAKDESNRQLIEGELTLISRRGMETRVEVEVFVLGNPDVRVEVNGKQAKQKSARSRTFELVLEPLKEKKLTIRTRP